MVKTKLVWVTPDAEKLLVHIARVSNPTSQEKGGGEDRLIRYLIKHKHWSPFSMVDMCLEIETSRAISRQILRHKSFEFQEFSLRYAEVLPEPIINQPRRQDTKNRQNSFDDFDQKFKEQYQEVMEGLWKASYEMYQQLLDIGVAKECARDVLPEGMCPSRIYMKGSLRSWIHYLQVRLDLTTQKEHQDVAAAIMEVFKENFPLVAKVISETADESKKEG